MMKPTTKKTRQSISTSTLEANVASKPTGSSSIPTLKKRSKSLGGLALEQKILGENRDSDDLTPRKKARRSLLPGKSILKSRPTITGLERTTSLTLTQQTAPNSINQNGASSSQPVDQSANQPGTAALSQPPTSVSQTHHEPNTADNSSDMDLSDDQGFPRSSLGSNTATLLRRVSFAAKAHVRTFGSPLLIDPDSSMASSNHSAGQPTTPSPGPTNTSEADQASSHNNHNNSSSDMSIASSLANEQRPTDNPPAKENSNDALITQAKASRLSMAIPGFGSYDDDDDDDDDANLDEGVQGQGQGQGQDQGADQTSDMSIGSSPASNHLGGIQQSHLPAKMDPPSSQDAFKQVKSSRLSMAIRGLGGFDEEDEDESDNQQDQGTTNMGSTQQAQPNKQADQIQVPDEPTTAHTQSKKPSRLTQLFSDWDDLSRELENARDGVPGPSLPSEDSETTTKKQRSRISEFLQPPQDSSDIEEQADSALIDFHDPTPSNPLAASIRPSNHRASSLSATISSQNVPQHPDLIDMSIEHTATQERSTHPSSPRSTLPELFQSRPPILSTSSEPFSRAGSLSRLSLEPVLPRLSAVRNSQIISSASPSRRLSGSLSGSPQKSRLSFASPRRSTVPAAPPHSSNQDTSRLTAENPRTNSTDPFTTTKESDSNIHQSSQLNLHSNLSTRDRSPSVLPPPPQPSPPPTLISLNEFFEQAEIRFISLSQPRVRNHDQQEHPHISEAQQRTSSFAQQIYAGMVKIPRLRLLESSSRTLRQKTELLDFTTKEHEGSIERNGQGSKLLQQWVHLQRKQAQLVQSNNSQASQKAMEDLNQIMNQLRLKKNWVEMCAKRDSLLFEIDMWKNYQSHFSVRTAKLNQDLEMMRKLDSIVKPSTESLRERKRNLTEEIRRRKQKNSEIENCDQNLLKALKEEAKDLAAETEANRRALAESDLERNLWLGKFAELEEEKNEHVQRIEQMKLDPDQSQKCTVQELIRLNNEFVMLQKMMGWELVRFDHNMMAFIFVSSIAITFHLDPLKSGQAFRNVGRIEFRWTPPASTKPCSIIQKDTQLDTIEQFFFGHLRAHYEGKPLQGRLKEFVQEITSIWHQARQLMWEIKNVQGQFSTGVQLSKEGAGNGEGQMTMDVVVTLRAPRTRAVAHCHFLFSGEEVLDWKAPSPLAHVSCKVDSPPSDPKKKPIDCLNLSYVLSEHIDKGHQGALKEACLEALACLDR